MWTRQAATSALARTGFVIGAIVCLTVTSGRAQLASEQSGLQPGHRLDTGVFTVFGGHELAITVTDVGAPEVTSFVRIRVLNDKERAIFTADRTLKRGQPARLELPFGRDFDRALVRVSIQITGTPGRLTSPIAVVEDIDPASRTIVVRGLCSAPGGRGDPVVPMCPGWEVTDIAAPE